MKLLNIYKLHSFFNIINSQRTSAMSSIGEFTEDLSHIMWGGKYASSQENKKVSSPQYIPPVGAGKYIPPSPQENKKVSSPRYIPPVGAGAQPKDVIDFPGAPGGAGGFTIASNSESDIRLPTFGSGAARVKPAFVHHKPTQIAPEPMAPVSTFEHKKRIRYISQTLPMMPCEVNARIRELALKNFGSSK